MNLLRAPGGVVTHLVSTGAGTATAALCGYRPGSFTDKPGRPKYRWLLGSGHFMCERCLDKGLAVFLHGESDEH